MMADAKGRASKRGRAPKSKEKGPGWAPVPTAEEPRRRARFADAQDERARADAATRAAKGEPEEAENLVDPEMEALAELMSSVPADSRVELFRFRDDHGWAYLTRMAVEGFDLDAVARKHGGGRYRIRVYGPNELGRIVPRGSRVFTIDPSIPPPPKEEPKSAGTASIVESGILQMMQVQTEMIRVLADRKDSTPELLKVIVDAVKQPVREKGEDAYDVALKIVQLLNSKKESGTDLDTLLGLVERIRGMAEEMGGEGGGGGSLMKLAESVGKVVDRAIESEKVKGGRVPASVIPLPAGGPMAALRPLLAHLPLVLEAARAGSDPTLYAELLWDRVSDEMLPQLMPVLTDAEYPDNVVRVLPAPAQPYVPWLRRMFVEVKRIAEEESEESVDDNEYPIGGISEGGDAEGQNDVDTAGRPGDGGDGDEDEALGQ